MAKQKIRNAFDRQRVQFKTEGESLTQQHFETEQDVRNIIKQYDRTGLITNVARGVARYGDYSEVNEYREALDLVNNATSSFMELPAKLREMFNNNPGEFFEFATNPENADQMVQLGLSGKPVQEEQVVPTTKAEIPPAPQEAGE